MYIYVYICIYMNTMCSVIASHFRAVANVFRPLRTLSATEQLRGELQQK